MNPAELNRDDREMSDGEADDALRMLASTIKDDFTFIRVLRDADPSLRRGVYDKLAPLVAYIPRPFDLMTFDADA